MKGFVLAEAGHVINAVAPIDINGSGATSDVWSMRRYQHASIIVSLGVVGAATTVTVFECDDFVPTNATAIAFSYYAEVTAGGDVLEARAAATAAGFASSTNNGIFYVIEVDASQLSDGYPCMKVALSDPSAATLASVQVIQSGARYGVENSPTEIA